ncbi:MAG TPA: type II toxin-antitoxin system prevent-host-death family antitoxin [Terriglobia bacterium]|nr:type II toxin-antitoxin system prevent-host-death family antitoxin [Terriglobia bacterium]
METVGLFEAKNKLSELVERASHGHKIGITRRGKLAALIVPARPEASVKEIFDDIEQVRKRAKLPKGVSVKDLIEEGRV